VSRAHGSIELAHWHVATTQGVTRRVVARIGRNCMAWTAAAVTRFNA
jgi:hypothetical protein